ncbi:hypothetical protein FH609_014995 [Streptomyces sp. 3MP-14]|uniref:Uncharacterized protein n=1 Tax=Streptomyces mimosae TaxID=2586635 RepID=A0A5N6ABV1_9ACTN|nr:MULTISPECIES: GTPase-associated protein 1-related protein [Streptomyces]KAB8165725.1 hypothetical protein FH607_012320 [Streptomyces mimosae]KAB8176114.1 hypothetical protein FH609_014995 [Streptomyces sp. 3MP-14]
MAFSQLYYTSCEHGLSGFSGYQFNAVSEDVSTETMRQVEALTGYEPPPSMLYADAPEDLARCPVNLCHLPGPITLTACVRYLGRDASQRFGNYFAHALASTDFAVDGGYALPIELWEAPVWTSTPADGTRLPRLPGPPPAGPLSPAGVERFVRAHPHGGALPGLLTAVTRALATDRTVLVVDGTSEDVAHWFAAVSYLLPPPVARGLSFATYVARPERSRLRLVGTVPEIGAPTGPDARDGLDVFDLAGGALPEGPASPLARLLDRVGPAASGAFWSWAAEYAEGTETAAEDWYLPAVAAAATGSIPLTGDDLAAVIPWLAAAEHLDAPALAEVARHVYPLGPFSDEQSRSLVRAATAGGDRELVEHLQTDLLDSELRRHMAGEPGLSPPVAFTDDERAEHALGRVRSLLAEADAEHAAATRLLLWADAADLRLPRREVAATCRRIADGLLGGLTTRPADPRLDAELRQLADARSEFRRQLVLALAEGPPRPPGHSAQLLAALPEGLLTEADLVDHPELWEGQLIATAERQPADRAGLLPRVLEVRGDGELPGSLLRTLWPNGQFTHRQALDVAHRLPAGLRLDEAAREWFSAAVRLRPEDETQLRACLTLCQLLGERHRVAWLTEDGQDCRAQLLELNALLASPHPIDSGTLVDVVMRPWPTRWFSVHGLLRLRLPRAAARCRATPSDVSLLLSRMGHETGVAYLRALRAELPRVPQRLAMAHAEGLAAAAEILEERRWLLAREALDALAAGWRAEDVERLAARVRPHSPGYAARLLELAGKKRRGRMGRLARRMPWRRGGD